MGNTYSYGAGGSDAFFLKLKPNGDITVSSGFTPELSDIGLKVFPNPSSEVVTISSSDNSELPSGLIQIFDIQGKLVKEVNIPKYQSRVQLNIQGLSKGSYFIKLQGKELRGVSRLIIQR